MRFTATRHRRSLVRALGALLLSVASTVAAAQALPPFKTDAAPLREITVASDMFVRGAPLPAWAELLVLPSDTTPTAGTPAVVRLWETQLFVAPSPVSLTHRVMQINDASALVDIGQTTLEFNPPFERLLLHKLVIVRGAQTIDHTRTAPVRLLQREARLEQGVDSGVVTVSIVLPDVRVGDRLQLVYSIVGPTVPQRARYSQRTLWDQPHAVAWRRITLVVPSARRVRWRWFGGADGNGPSPTEIVTAGLRRLRFEARDLAAAAAEPMTPPRISVMRQLQFSEYANWNDVARWATHLFPADAPLPKSMAPLIARLRALKDREQRASQALQWVQREIRACSAARSESTVRPQAPALVASRGWGDCKDKALLLSVMLRKLGIDARPALASLATRSGPASMLPAPDVFDHVIVEVALGGRRHYLDATSQGQVGLLSHMGQRLEEAAVLPIAAGTRALVIVRSPNRAAIFRTELEERLALPQLGGEGRLEVEMRWFGSQAESLRVLLLRMDATERRRFVAAGYEQQYEGCRLLGDPEISDDQRYNQLTIRARFALPLLARALGEHWAVAFAANLGDALDMPALPGRRFALALPSYPLIHRYRIEMTWPEGMTIDSQAASSRWQTEHVRLLTTRSVRSHSETRTVEFSARVGEVPAGEVLQLAADLAEVEARAGGVMMALGQRPDDTPPRADPP
jgi:transglutaminase-like putative cysteine protease